MSAELMVAIAVLAVSIIAPISGMILFFERRLAKLETKLDIHHEEFHKLKSAILGML